MEVRREGWGRNMEDSRIFSLQRRLTFLSTVDPWSQTVTVVAAVWRGFTNLLYPIGGKNAQCNN